MRREIVILLLVGCPKQQDEISHSPQSLTEHVAEINGLLQANNRSGCLQPIIDVLERDACLNEESCEWTLPAGCEGGLEWQRLHWSVVRMLKSNNKGIKKLGVSLAC